MSLTEIEFVLSAAQYELLGFAGLKQGQPLSLLLDAGILVPDPAAESWFSVQKDPLESCLVAIGPATYAFSGQIQEAELCKEEVADGVEESAVLIVECAGVPLRVTCIGANDGRLPFGTWETRYLTGVGRIQGIFEEDHSVPLGRSIGATVWGVRRLLLTPGDPFFGRWHESDDLANTPFIYDTVLIKVHLHQNKI